MATHDEISVRITAIRDRLKATEKELQEIINQISLDGFSIQEEHLLTIKINECKDIAEEITVL